MPDGRLLFTGEASGIVRSYDVRSGNSCSASKAHSEAVHAVAVSPDSQLIASAYEDGTITLWNASAAMHDQEDDGTPLLDRVNGATLSHDGESCAVQIGQNNCQLWDVRAAEQRCVPECPADTFMAFSPVGQAVAIACRDTVRLWDMATDTVCRNLREHDNICKSDKAPSAYVVATDLVGSNERLCLRCGAGGNKYLVLCAAISPDGQLLASGYDDNNVRLWDVATGAALHTLRGHADEVCCVVFSSAGHLLASALIDGIVWLWDRNTGVACRNLQCGSKRVRWITFSPDGQWLAASSDNKMIRLWETEVGLEYYSREANADTIAFSPDGQLLACSSYRDGLKIWDTTSGKLLHAIEDPDNHQQPLFSADGWSIETSRGAILLPSSLCPNDIRGTRALFAKRVEPVAGLQLEENSLAAAWV